MAHHIEVAASGRATCKTCKQRIDKDTLRLGEEYASQFGEGGMAVRWHHLACGADALPAVLREAMTSYEGEIPDRAALEAKLASAKPTAAKAGALPTADLAPTGRAKCIHCTEAIEKGSVRIAVEREVDRGGFVTTGAGYLHPACAEAWAGDELEALLAKVREHSALPSLPPPF